MRGEHVGLARSQHSVSNRVKHLQEKYVRFFVSLKIFSSENFFWLSVSLKFFSSEKNLELVCR